MAAENGRTDAPLNELLFAEPYRFEFLQTVRLLERLYPQRQPVGRYGAPADEVARFRAHVSLAFPPSEVHDLSPNGKHDTPPEMIVAFMGLSGPQGVLPHPYTEQVIEAARARRVQRRQLETNGTAAQTQAEARPEEPSAPPEHSLVDFLDLFNHRLISLFYRAWEKYRFPIGYERGDEDVFTHCLFALIGLGTGGLRGRQAFSDDSLLAYGGLLAQQPHSACALAALLRDYFGVAVRVEQLVPQRLKLDESSTTRLGAANSQLGVVRLPGRRCWIINRSSGWSSGRSA